MNVRLDRKVWIDRRVTTKSAATGAAKVSWVPFAEVWAERQDFLPAQAESVRQGLETWSQRARYRIRWRSDVDATMRLRDGGRTLQIVGGPAELGRRDFLELVCEEFATTGGPA